MHSTTYALDSTWRPLLADLGVCAPNVLRRADLPHDLLTRQSVRLDAADFHRFWEGLDAEMADPLMPLRVCQAVRSESFSPALFAALCSPNFLIAMQRLARYKALVAPIRLTVCEVGEQVTLTLIWPDATNQPPASLAVAELLFLVALARMGTREPLRPLWVATITPPAPDDTYAAFLGVSMRSGPRHQIGFARADVVRPFLTSNDGLWAAFEPALRTRLAALDATVTVGQRVRAVLLEALPGGLVDMQAVARTLAMSRRSLQRHLEAEGLTYQTVLQQTRLALAQHYLNNTALRAAEIAFLLGFEEPNSFFRAFRCWTGHTPNRMRTQT